MDKKQFVVAYRLAFAVLIPVTIAVQLAYSLEQAQNFSTVNFFSYFTIQSNLFAAVILLMSAYVLRKRKKDPQLESLRGAAVLYMVVTGIIYNLLLRGNDGTLLAWVNDVLHRVVPLVMLFDWLYWRSVRKFSAKEALLWLIYPVVYAAYTLVHGPLARHWYPYPFISVALHGYARVALNCVIIAICMLVLALVLSRVPRLKLASRTKPNA